MQDSFLTGMMLWEFLEPLSPKSQAKEPSQFFRAEEVVLRVDQESSTSSGRSALPASGDRSSRLGSATNQLQDPGQVTETWKY